MIKYIQIGSYTICIDEISHYWYTSWSNSKLSIYMKSGEKIDFSYDEAKLLYKELNENIDPKIIQNERSRY